MCGIYGSTRLYSKDVLERKVKQFSFRGPDCSKMVNYGSEESPLILAHNRLAMDNLSALANQPMEYANGNIVVVLDGNIYNCQQLKKQYFSDVKFATQSGVVVLCALYERFGENCVEYINGDFAFVIYDKNKNQLFGAVDRLGDKPFYYSQSSEGFEFCSQLFPLCIGNHYDIDEFARKCYFSMQYIPSPYSIIKQIKKLNPAERFTYSFNDRKLRVEQYWDLYDNTCKFTVPSSYNQAVEQVDALIDDSVRLRLNSDVPVGLFLSGGIDSSTISMYAHRHNSEIQAFSIGFNESDFDESDYARQVAAQIGIKLNHIVCSSDEAIDILNNLQNYYDEPMGDASAIPTSLLCQQTGKYVKIALGGDGGDEMFFGYPRYLKYAERKWIYSLPRPVLSLASTVVQALGKDRLAMSLMLDNVQQLYMNRRPSNTAEKFNARDIQQSLEQCRYLYENKDVRRAFNDFDIKTLMAHAYNVKLDRAAMRSALDVRTPMLDYRIVEYSRLLPIDYCYKKQTGQKRILRELLSKEIDINLFNRKKQGFGVPIGVWFKKELREVLCDTLNEQSTHLLPDFDAVELIKVRDRHINGTENQSTLLWHCYNYLCWLRIFERLCD